MKTARFADVVEASGRPDPHILLTRPEDDRALQAAIRSHRVMTIHQDGRGERADRGTVGFDPGPSRQFLIFPRALSQFAGRFILAINFDLLQADAHAPSKRPAKKGPDRSTRMKDTKPPTRKIIPFKEPVSPERRNGGEQEPKDAGTQLGKAIGLLKQGKQAAALKLLRKLEQSLRTQHPESTNVLPRRRKE